MQIPPQLYNHEDRTIETCLLVDDDEFDRSQMRRVVERQRPDVQIVEFGNLTDARRYLANASAQIIMLDNRLPDGRGADFALELRKETRMENVPIIVITNDDLSTLEHNVAALSKDDLSATNLGAVISEFLKARRIAKTSDSAHLVQEFGVELQENLSPAFSRAIRTLRGARAQIMRTAPLSAIEALEQVEDILLAVSQVTSEKKQTRH